MRGFLLVAMLIGVSRTGGAEEANPTPTASPTPESVDAAAPARVGGDWHSHWMVTLDPGTKNLSLGLAIPHDRWLETEVETDAVVTSLLTGFGLDHLDALRLSADETFGGELSTKPLGFHPRWSRRARSSNGSRIVAGAGVWGLAEFDSMAQALRIGHSGFYTGVAVGPFVSLETTDVTVSLLFRPLTKTAYYLDGRWDSTPLGLATPTLDVEVSYAFGRRR